MKKKITVIGSTNVDLCSTISHLPAAGETVTGGRFMQANGGKGANQAIAASRLGGDVTFISALGDDSLGTSLLAHFNEEGIDTENVFRIGGESTGIALILIDSKGENVIAVNPGANGCLTPGKIEECRGVIETSDLIVMQAEIPYESVKLAASIAAAAGVKVLYNPAPVCEVDNGLMSAVDLLVVNRNEAATLSGAADYREAAAELHRRGAGWVVVTLGSEGAYCFNGKEELFVPSFKVKAVDAVGAGDTFCGALAVSFAENGTVDAATMKFASAAAAISVTRPGAQPSIPTKEETSEFLKTRV